MNDVWDFLLPYEPRSPQERRELIQSCAIALVWTMSAMSYSLLFYIWDCTLLLRLHFFLGLLLSATPLLLRWTRSCDLVVQYELAVGWLLIALGAHFSGGFERTGMVWLFIPPVFSGLMAGVRSVMLYFGISTVYLLACWFDWLGPLAPYRTFPKELLAILGPMDILGVSAVVGLGVVALQETRLRLERVLEQEVAVRRKAELEALAAAHAKATFLATMSHELRTPMNGVLGMAELLADDQLTKSQREGIEIIKSSARSLLAVVNDILDFSKLEAGKVVLDPRPTDVALLVREVAKVVRHTRRVRSEVELRVKAPVRLGLHVDDSRLRQVLLNLVGNAAKFTERGFVEICVETAGDKTIFSVKDSGIGISPDQLKSLFKPFEQAESSTARRFGGTGLGLSIANKLVKAMGGTVDVASKLGVGSTFSFSLNLLEAPLTEPQVKDSGNEGSLSGTVLIVDDSPVNLKVAAMMISRMGLQPETVASGLEALDRIKLGDIDAILMDVQMPEMDGLEATRRVRSSPHLKGQMPIIGLSANILETHREEGLKAGMDAYLGKPIDRLQLRCVLKEALLSRKKKV